MKRALTIKLATSPVEPLLLTSIGRDPGEGQFHKPIRGMPASAKTWFDAFKVLGIESKLNVLALL